VRRGGDGVVGGERRLETLRQKRRVSVHVPPLLGLKPFFFYLNQRHDQITRVCIWAIFRCVQYLRARLEPTSVEHLIVTCSIVWLPALLANIH
jgi:hypothetical protein